MHSPEKPSRRGDLIQQAQSIADAAMRSTSGTVHPFTLVICDVDVPCFITDGEVYVQAPLQIVHDALSAQMVEFLRDLEARISETRRAALASVGVFPAVHVTNVVSGDVV